MENSGLNWTDYGQNDLETLTTSVPVTTSTQPSLNEVRIFDFPLALVLCAVILVYLLLVMLAVCLYLAVSGELPGCGGDFCEQCSDLGMTFMHCCSCSCKCSDGYACMQYAGEELRLLFRDCSYCCTDCWNFCKTPKTNFLRLDSFSSLL